MCSNGSTYVARKEYQPKPKSPRFDSVADAGCWMPPLGWCRQQRTNERKLLSLPIWPFEPNVRVHMTWCSPGSVQVSAQLRGHQYNRHALALSWNFSARLLFMFFFSLPAPFRPPPPLGVLYPTNACRATFPGNCCCTYVICISAVEGVQQSSCIGGARPAAFDNNLDNPRRVRICLSECLWPPPSL